MLSVILRSLVRTFVISNARYYSIISTKSMSHIPIKQLLRVLDNGMDTLNAVSATELIKEIINHNEYETNSEKKNIWSAIIGLCINHKLPEIYPNSIWSEIKSEYKSTSIDQKLLSQLALYYANNGKFIQAMDVLHWLDTTYNIHFNQRPIRLTDKVYNIMLTTFNRLETNNMDKYLEAIRYIHLHLQQYNVQNILIYNTLITVYAKFGEIDSAQNAFHTIKRRKQSDSYNAMIGIYISNKHYQDVMDLYEEMKQNKIPPDHVTFLSLIKACGHNQNNLSTIHEHIKRNEYSNNIKIANALIVQYTKCGNIEQAKTVFSEIKPFIMNSTTEKNHIFQTMLHCLVESGCFDDALNLYEDMKQTHANLMDDFIFSYAIKSCNKENENSLKNLKSISNDVKHTKYRRNINVLNALITQYGKLNDDTSALQIFDSIPDEFKDFITYSAMINVFAQHNRYAEAMKVYQRMKKLNMKQNAISYLVLLKACTNMIDLMRIHEDIQRDALGEDIKIQNSLIHLYSKYGNLQRAVSIFQSIPKQRRDIVTYTVMMQSYKEYELLDEAMSIYDELQQQTRIKMNESCYLVVIGCCGSNKSNLNMIHGEIRQNKEFGKNIKI